MAPFDNWNTLEDEQNEELEDTNYFSGKDVLLFCIDASKSMLEPRETLDGKQKSYLQNVLEIAVLLQRRKVITSPNDLMGILFFNTEERSETKKGAEIKDHCYVYQPIAQVNAESIQDLLALVDDVTKDPSSLRDLYPPNTGQQVPIGDVFTSCNWVIRDGAPKTGIKRIFFVTDEDDPHPLSVQLMRTAQTTCDDLSASGVLITPFFINDDKRAFDRSKFWDHVLPCTDDNEDEASGQVPDVITELSSLVQEMKIREVPKRAVFSVPMHLAEGFTIGMKGYGLVTQQKKPPYKYFTNGKIMEEAKSKTIYYDEEFQKEYDKSQIMYGMTLGPITDESPDNEEDFSTTTGVKRRVFFTADEIKSFRTLDLQPGIKLLGFKDSTELAFEDNIKHSHFIYPDELAYTGSTRTFAALLKSMLAKDKIGLALVVTRRNSAPQFCALMPQAERLDENGTQLDPPGIHLQPLPFADDIRAAPVECALRAGEKLKNAARMWIDKLTIKNGSYQPNSYPNPALALFWGQLEAKALQEEYDFEGFSDLSAPQYDPMHKRAGQLMKDWKEALEQDASADQVIVTTGMKRKPDVSLNEVQIRTRWEAGTLEKLKNDQLKDFLKSKGLSVGGKKADLVERAGDWLERN